MDFLLKIEFYRQVKMSQIQELHQLDKNIFKYRLQAHKLWVEILERSRQKLNIDQLNAEIEKAFQNQRNTDRQRDNLIKKFYFMS
jgi:hypothetical protein